MVAASISDATCEGPAKISRVKSYFAGGEPGLLQAGPWP